MSTETNKAAVRRFNEEVFNQGNEDVIDELCDSGYTNHFAGIHGREEFKEAVRKAKADSSFHVQVRIEGMIAEGDTVAVLVTHTDSGKKQISYYRLVNGRIKDDWYFVQPPEQG